ncbi:hypothetical protein BDM02DRAFT_3131316 [Thelephora ganbajun]|uniref:Uncharacterized protein n=1 Tax=Thelephora ganbajun TaxID=370292 RepID=A0ACB6Z614_THEGA|nr:hypothetical protein BDM02DRAFT_3131316 [Thelephora ganbajun]
MVMNAAFNCRLTVSCSPIVHKVVGFNFPVSRGVCQFNGATNGHHALKANLEGLERQYLTLVEINRHFIEWRHQLGQLEQKVALYRAWDVLPESLKRLVAQPPPLLENLRAVVKAEQDQVLGDAWNVLANYVAGSWSMVKQSVDATFEDIRKRELLAELELRVIEIQCSAPVMWIAPSQRICQGFPMVISHSCPTPTSSVILANEGTSPNYQNIHLSLVTVAFA